MSRLLKLALWFYALVCAASLQAAEATGVNVRPGRLAHGILTNSMVTSWIVALVVIVAVRLAIGKPKLIPTRGQAVIEGLVQWVINMTRPIVGEQVAEHTFPLLIGLTTYILVENWSGLFPGVGTIFFHRHEFVRPGNVDLNSTLALAVVSTLCWLYFILRYAGVRAVVKDLFGNKADRREVPGYVYFPLFLVFFLVGLTEIISILLRPVSLSLRLFGNMFGGENLLHSMSAISRWGLPIPFYVLETLVGFVQAMVFVLLVSVYIGLICNHDEGHGEGDGEH